jgi:bile acid-coenzyme A ligase
MTDPSFDQIMAAHGSGPAAAETAITYPGERLSWAELETRSTARARRLVSFRVEPDDLVAIALPNGIEHHVSSFAAWRAGATPCILPTKLPGHELAQVIELATPRVLIGIGDAPDGVAHLVPGDDSDAEADLAPDLAAAHWKAVTSGGSTGRPKLIVDHAAARFGERLNGLVDLVRMPRGGVILNPGPLYHNAPFLFTSLALLAGSRVIGMHRFDAEEALRLIEAERVQWVCMVPTMMQRIWNLPEEVRSRYDLSSLQCVCHMAAACPAWLKQAWIDWLGPERIFEVYAGTEGAALFITGEEWLAKPGSVGKAPAELVTIVDENGAPCPPNVVGEIFFGGDAGTRFHYIGADAKLDGAGRLSLGDLGYIDEDGYLFLSDRRSDMIIRGGANIYAAEVEAALSEHPAVADAVVVGLPCDDLGQRVHAIIQPTGELPIGEVEAFVQTRLAKYKCPESYEVVTEALRSDAGKVRRTALRDERLIWLQDGKSFQLTR